MDDLDLLKVQAKLLASAEDKDNLTLSKLDSVLERLGDRMPINQFEAFCETLTPSHVGMGYTR